MPQINCWPERINYISYVINLLKINIKINIKPKESRTLKPSPRMVLARVEYYRVSFYAQRILDNAESTRESAVR